MERASFTRQETDAVNLDEKRQGTSSALDSRESKESLSGEKTSYHVNEPEVPPYHDTEAYIGEGEIKALETAEDIVTTVIHLDDDPDMNPWTFRMFFIGE